MSFWFERDASWWPNPDTRKPKRVHQSNGHGVAICSDRIHLIAPGDENPTESRKCKRCLAYMKARKDVTV